MKSLRILIVIALFSISISAIAQNKIIVSGVVTDIMDNKSPLIGVNVYDKNNVKLGVVTDGSGRYSISLPDSTTLVFKYVGYLEEEVRVANSTEINMQLAPDLTEIAEVVVVGTALKRTDLTGAVATITAENIESTPTSSVVNAMQGKVAGIYVQSSPTPGSGSTIKIRGNNSIQYGTNPIFVVDGLVIDNGFQMLNPDDIASIDILKDASATAIYGSRGANGVVVITTKKGKNGVKTVNLDSWIGFQDFSKDIPLMNGNQTYDLRVDAYANAYMDKNPNADRERYIEKSLTNPNPIKNLIFSAQELESYTNGETYNWLNEVTRKGFQQNHAVSFSGGDDNGNYFISLNYNQQKGQIVKSGYNRYTAKVNTEQKINNWLKIGTNSSFIASKENPVVNDNMFITALRACPLLPISDEYWYMREGKIDNQSATNPLRDLTITKDSYNNRVLSSNYININPIEGLNFRSTYSIDLLQAEQYSYFPTTSTQSYSAANNGQSIQLRSKIFNWQWDNSLSYNRLINNTHKVSVLLGTNMSYYSYNYNQQNASGYNNDLFTYKYVQGASDKDKFYLASDFSTYTIKSYLVQTNYSYKSRYNLTLTGRSDGSSKFGPKHKWGFFPSIAASWNISNEAFMLSQSLVSDLRVRAGYGIAGNQNIPNYGYMTIYNPSISLGSNILTNGGRYGNPDLRWEKQKQINLGLNAGFIENRINLTFDLFKINNEDLILERSIAASSGYTKKIDNVGALENKGLEFALNASVIDKKAFKWNVAFNIAADRNKITKLYDDVTEIYNLGGYSNNEIQREGNLFLGQPLNTIYVYKFDRIAQESDMDYVNSLDLGSRIVRPGDILPLDKHTDGKIDDQDRFVVGKKDPDFYGGLSTNLSYKGVSLSVSTFYSKGAKRISYLYETLMSSVGNSAAHADLSNRWTPQNTNTNIPRAYSDGGRFNLSDVDWAVQDASFFRVSDITLSYVLPSSWVKAVKLQNFTLYVTGNNLLTLTKYKGFDPESGDWYPSYKMYVGGIKVSF